MRGVDGIITTGLAIAAIGYLVAMYWYFRAALNWQRAAFPTARPGSLSDFLMARARGPALTHNSPDVKVEPLRVIARRRMVVLMFLVPSVIYIPALFVTTAVALVLAIQIGLIATAIVAVAVAIIGVSVLQVVGTIVVFGNGGDVSPRRFVDPVGRIAVFTVLLVVQTAVMIR
jgi:hypothetical protein